MSDAEIDDGTWVSMAEAARRLGITRQAVKGRIARGSLETKVRGNRGLLVRLPATLPAALPKTLPATLPEALPANPLQDVVDRQREEMAAMRERIARLETMDQMRQELIVRLEATNAMRREEIADLRSERDRLLGVIEAQTEQMKLLTDHRQHPPKPRWRRWFGR